MKLLTAIAVALVACTDFTDAWTVKVYKGLKLKGTYAYMSGKSRSGGKCCSINSLHGPNLAGHVGAIWYKAMDTKANSVCSAYLHDSSNCKGSRGNSFASTVFDGGSSTASYKKDYRSFYISCRSLRRRSEIEAGGEWNATESVLEDIDLAASEDGENSDLEDRKGWEEYETKPPRNESWTDVCNSPAICSNASEE